MPKKKDYQKRPWSPTAEEIDKGRKIYEESGWAGLVKEFGTVHGKTIKDTQWINVEAWGTLANIVESYLQKGSQVYIEGRLKTQKYKKNGETKYFTKVVVRDMLMLGRSSNEVVEPDEDDIPF